MKVRSKELSNKKRIEVLDALYTAAGTVKGRESSKNFLKNLLTESERIMIGRRILIARALISGSTYDSIVEEYGAGKDTINKIARWLDDQLPGYEKVINDMEGEFAQRKEGSIDKVLYATSVLYRLKKKYPMHFLLFPTPKRKK